MSSLRRRSPSHAPRRGQALFEFAIIATVLAFILSAILTFGLMFWTAQGIQQAVDVAAQEIARMPFAPAKDLGLGKLQFNPDDVMWTTEFKSQIYDQSLLVFPQSALPPDTSFFTYATENFPLLNRLLAQHMIFDPSFDGGVYRFPGAIVEYRDPITNAPYRTILVPVVDYGTNQIAWLSPVEEITTPDTVTGTALRPFSIVLPSGASPPASFVPGLVAIRINYPFQSGSLVARSPGSTDSSQSPITATDAALTAADTTNYTLVVANDSYAPNTSDIVDARNLYGGRYGLGRSFAFVEQMGVRPYRRIVSTQAVYRREVFE